MYKSVYALLMGILAVSLSGCLQQEAPKCSDSDVKELVKEIYAENLVNLQKENPFAAMFIGTLPKKIVRIDSTRPVKYEENIKLRTCKGVAYFEDNRSANIEYTVQLDEKNADQYYVELDLSFLDGLAKQGMMENIFKGLDKK